MAGMGPCSTMARRAARWVSFRIARRPGALPLISPAGPCAVKRTTQSRTLCRVTQPTRALDDRNEGCVGLELGDASAWVIRHCHEGLHRLGPATTIFSLAALPIASRTSQPAA